MSTELENLSVDLEDGAAAAVLSARPSPCVTKRRVRASSLGLDAVDLARLGDSAGHALVQVAVRGTQAPGKHRARRDETADAWMLTSGKAALLTHQQEQQLATRIEQGDRRAREELLNANVRLVASVARRYQNRGLPLDDLMQEGLIGLLRAIEKFNYRKGYRFSTYATHWIRQAVTRALANQSRCIRLPAHVVDAISRVARVREDLFNRLGRLPTRAEVASEAGITEKKLALLLRSIPQPVSLDAAIGEEGDTRLGDFLPASEETSPTARLFHFLVREEVDRALDVLTARERDVIVLRFGLDTDEPLTLEETGRQLQITRERARQIEAKALDKLRHAWASGHILETVN